MYSPEITYIEKSAQNSRSLFCSNSYYLLSSTFILRIKLNTKNGTKNGT